MTHYHRTVLDTAPSSAWFKSSYSSENGTACVEVADLSSVGRVGIRDSKDPARSALVVPAGQFVAFIADVRGGRLAV